MMNLSNLKYFKKPGDIKLFVKVFFSLLALKILLETVKLPRLLRLLEPKKRVEVNNTKIEHITKFSNFILYNIFRSSKPCMLRSLMLFRYLRLRGMDIKISFGVKDGGNVLKGHAWLIHKETYFLEHDDPSREYKVVFVYP